MSLSSLEGAGRIEEVDEEEVRVEEVDVREGDEEEEEETGDEEEEEEEDEDVGDMISHHALRNPDEEDEDDEDDEEEEDEEDAEELYVERSSSRSSAAEDAVSEQTYDGDEDEYGYSDTGSGVSELEMGMPHPTDNFARMVQQAREERDHLVLVNEALQREVSALAQSSHSTLLDSDVDGEGQRLTAAQYHKQLERASDLLDELQEERKKYRALIVRQSQRLDVQDVHATELNNSFKAFKREIAKEAEFSRTGKPIRYKRILAFEAQEEEKDKEVEAVRLRRIHYTHKLEELEDKLKEKEELEEGLHLIDFEQLKIENQTHNEKIEERNDELHKLRKKTTNTVQVLTHIKEKLKFVAGENETQAEELARLEHQVTDLRDRLTQAKHVRDETRRETAKLKQKQGFVESDMLVADFERRRRNVQAAEERLQQLKDEHRRLTKSSRRMKYAT